MNQVARASLVGGAGDATLGSLTVSAMQYLPTDSLNIGTQVSKALVAQYQTAGDAVAASDAVKSVVDALAATNRPSDEVQIVRGLLAADSTGKDSIRNRSA
ncbi:MAG: hypothetical protein WDN28_21085 [Chthoniobacter sp.]